MPTGTSPTQRAARLTRAVRTRMACTGEHYTGVLQDLAAHPARSLIPAAATVDQARLESEFLHRGSGLSAVARHPMGLVRLHPRPQSLTAVLEREPAVVRHWAERLLPIDAGPREEIAGICGLRYSRGAHHVRLYRQDTDASIELTGFPVRWWDRAVQAILANARTAGASACFTTPGGLWTRSERCLYDCITDSHRDLRLGSQLLRRIRLTAGEGVIAGTDVWSSPAGRRQSQWVVETVRGPEHDRLFALLMDPQLELGLTELRRTCGCGQGEARGPGGCTAELGTADDSQQVLVRDLRWSDSAADRARRTASLTKGNRQAFKSWDQIEASPAR
ncbi:hypothetical protein [Streptacidiphilus sp. EB103A]|uniref:hypothetical protein n=1 Tax=Streptacidiphilus sp. EB103A TaxID=3156275 RepID=UPI0035169EA4